MGIGKWSVTIKDLIWIIICLVIVICIFIGLFTCDNENAASILSNSSTAISIVLSIVAILYTMIEGANSSRINQDSQNKLESINQKLQEVTDKIAEQKELDNRIKNIVPKISTAYQEIKKNQESVEIDDTVKASMADILQYINEDIDG